MSCIEKNAKLTSKQAKTFDILVEFPIGCLHVSPFSTSVYSTALYIRYRVPGYFMCLVDV